MRRVRQHKYLLFKYQLHSITCCEFPRHPRCAAAGCGCVCGSVRRRMGEEVRRCAAAEEEESRLDTGVAQSRARRGIASVNVDFRSSAAALGCGCHGTAAAPGRSDQRSAEGPAGRRRGWQGGLSSGCFCTSDGSLPRHRAGSSVQTCCRLE